MTLEYSKEFINSKTLNINKLMEEINEVFFSLVKYIWGVDNSFYIELNREVNANEKEVIDDIVKSHIGIFDTEDKIIIDKEVVIKEVSVEEVLFKEYSLSGVLESLNIVLDDDDCIVVIYIDNNIFLEIGIKDIINFFNSNINNVLVVEHNLEYGEYVFTINFNNKVVNNNLKIYLKRAKDFEIFKIKYVIIKMKGK